MKVMTLNIWGYGGDWKSRKSKIISAIIRENPDIVFMQEVFDDLGYQAKDGIHQGEQLNQQLGYKNLLYDIAEQHPTYYRQNAGELAFDGLMCLTNLKVLEHGVVRLKREEANRHHRAIQIIKVSVSGREVLFYNVHYSNTNDWSLLHLQETKDYLDGKHAAPIIVGDFNILKPEIIRDVLGEDFECSYEIERYISFPEKGEVLDYIVIPKKQYVFKSVKCGYDDCSDHRAVIADVEVG